MMRSPFWNDLLSLRNSVDQIFRENPFGDAFGTVWSRPEPQSNRTAFPMPLDIYSTDDDVVILAAVPGMQPDDLDLTIHRNTVTISGDLHTYTGTGTTGSGEQSGSSTGSNLTWYLRELVDGTYSRSVTLPFPVDAENAEATFEHGILRVVLPKAETAKPKKVAIQSGQHEAIASGSGTQSS